MTYKTTRSKTRIRLLTSAAAAAMLMGTGTQLLAQAAPTQSSIVLDFMNSTDIDVAAVAPIDNRQVNQAAALDAFASTSTGAIVVLNELEAAGVSTLTGSFDTSGNAITGEGVSNRATNTISATTTPAFADSAAIASLQLNSVDQVSATSDDARIETEIRSFGTGSGDVRTLTGTLTMEDNRIATAVSGNRSTNTITIADSVSVSGLAVSATTTLTPVDTLASGSGSVDHVVSQADLLIANGQLNDGGLGSGMTIRSLTDDATITAEIQAVDDATVTLRGSAIGAEARGNLASSTIQTGEDAASIDSTFALSNLQANSNAAVTASATDAYVAAVIAEPRSAFDGSTVTVDATRITSLAAANDATQRLRLDANAINGAEGGIADIGNAGLSVTGQATLANLQTNDDVAVAATTTGNARIDIADTTGVAGGTITLSDTAFDATAFGNRGVAQAQALTGNTVGTGIGVASLQSDDADTTVTASTFAARADVSINGNLSGSEVAIRDGLTQAYAVSNMASTGITVDANGIPLVENAGSVAAGLRQATFPSVEAAFATANVQSTLGDVSALQTTGSGMSLDVVGNVSGSTLLVTGNDLVGAAMGNDAANRIALSMNSVASADGADADTVAGFAALAAAVTSQLTGPTASVRAQSFSAGQATEIEVTGDVQGAEVLNADSVVQALAIGNRSTANSVSIAANSLDTGTLTADSIELRADGLDADHLASTLAVGLQSVNGSTILATLTDDVSAPLSAGSSTDIRTLVTGDVVSSTVRADGNDLLATAMGNSGNNAVTLDIGSTLGSSAGVANQQDVTNAAIDALIGVQGRPSATTTLSAGFTAGSGGIVSAGTNLVRNATGGALTVALGRALTAEEAAYLSGLGFNATAGSTSLGWNAGVTIDVTTFTSGNLSSGASSGFSFAGFTIPAVNQDGGVRLSVNDVIDDSTLSVSGNLTAGAVTGNSATNALGVSANEIVDASLRTAALADDDEFVRADSMVINDQQVAGSTLGSNVFGTFAIDTNQDRAITGSTLSLEGNAQTASVTGNAATSSLTAEAGSTMASTAGLMNEQDASGTLSALSDLVMFTPVVSEDSTITVAGNLNRATATGNTGSNAIDLSATNLNGLGGGNAVLDRGNDAEGVAALYSEQDISGNVGATARTTAYNEHQADLTTTGILDGTVAFSGNQTTAEARANTVVNSVSLDATNLGASAALINEQDSSASVSATATADLGIDLYGTAGVAPVGRAAVANSTVLLDGNSTTAMASGNRAVNSMALNATNLTGAGGLAFSDGSANDLTASFGVMNDQSNNGPITASSTGASYGMVLNATGGTPPAALSASTVGVTGNTVMAQATGNIGSNALTVAALAADTTTFGVTSSQNNSGDITARIESATIGLSAFGAATGSTTSVSGNALGASAIGNTVINTITR